jgi:hypothetical protein
MCPHPFTVITLALLGFSSGAMAQKKPFKPNLGPNLPRITVHAGDVSLLLRQTSQWTPGRIDYRKIPMTTERSFYGTVFMFPEIGFIGTGHLENEPENLQSLHFFVDGKEIKTPGETIEADQSFKFHRTSKIRDFDLETTIEIHDNKLYETATIHAHKDVPLKLVYHFMHAWKPEISEFCTHVGGQTVSGKLNDLEENHRKFFINKPASGPPSSTRPATSSPFRKSSHRLEAMPLHILQKSGTSPIPTENITSPVFPMKPSLPGSAAPGKWSPFLGNRSQKTGKENAEVKARQLFDDPVVKPDGLKFTAMGCGPYTAEAEGCVGQATQMGKRKSQQRFHHSLRRYRNRQNQRLA